MNMTNNLNTAELYNMQILNQHTRINRITNQMELYKHSNVIKKDNTTILLSSAKYELYNKNANIIKSREHIVDEIV